MRNPATSRIEGARNIAVITAKLLQGEGGYFISNALAFGDRLFPLLEKGGYEIKNDRGEVLVEVKFSNPRAVKFGTRSGNDMQPPANRGGLRISSDLVKVQ